MVRTISLFFVLIASTVSLASAESGWLSDLRARYNIPNNSKLNDCNVCHSGQWATNTYGRDLRRAGIGNNVDAAFDATENLDSDGDGPDNLTELEAGTWPGDSGDIAPVEESSWGRIKALFN
jgi:hypothetical protein